MVDIINLMGNSKTTMLHWPQWLVYAIIPVSLILSVVRLVQDSIRLYKEDESNLGISKPSMDLDACEAIYREKLAAKRKELNQDDYRNYVLSHVWIDVSWRANCCSHFIALFYLISVNPVTTANFVTQSLYSGIASFTNLALPFFMISGTIMETGGLSKRLVRAANSLVGGITGSLGMVSVIACMFFGAVSGSAPATVAAIGSIMIPMMVQNGYNKYYATGLICCAGGWVLSFLLVFLWFFMG